MNNIQDQITALEERVKKLEEAFPLDNGEIVPVSKKKKSSVKEFLMAMRLNSDTKKVIALGYFLEYVEGMASFNVNDLEEVFRSAKEKKPGNINDSVNKNIARGFLMEATEKKESKKAWVLTNTGEQFIENIFKESK